MEGLRIRIPIVYCCVVDDCTGYSRYLDGICWGCKLRSLSWMRKEMTTTTFSGKSELVHSAPLRRYLSG